MKKTCGSLNQDIRELRQKMESLLKQQQLLAQILDLQNQQLRLLKCSPAPNRIWPHPNSKTPGTHTRVGAN